MSRGAAAGRDQHGDGPARQLSRERGQAVVLVLGPAGFDRHVLPASLRPLWKPATGLAHVASEKPFRNPITGILDCCARARSGPATVAAAPTSLTNVRRSTTG